MLTTKWEWWRWNKKNDDEMLTMKWKWWRWNKKMTMKCWRWNENDDDEIKKMTVRLKNWMMRSMSDKIKKWKKIFSCLSWLRKISGQTLLFFLFWLAGVNVFGGWCQSIRKMALMYQRVVSVYQYPFTISSKLSYLDHPVFQFSSQNPNIRPQLITHTYCRQNF